ncbi:MAG: DegT/DnrJ/EryC1/StrS family aminotransferase [Thermoplasmatales archaeon]|nr:MAG: DegT/DnrJ/EryC1/StrS family aminotransferase [Thermoplasmatales archaeon]
MVIASTLPTLDKKMEEEVLRALREEFFVGGKSVDEFEADFARYIGVDHAVAVSSGTDALTIALRCLDIKKDVITTSMTFVATPESIVLSGARPKFGDIDTESYNISPEEINKLISEQTEAIMPVHLYGLPCDMKEITDIAEDKGIKIIEDAAQSHGAQCGNRKVGSIGDVGCFSFYSTKNLTVGGNGGMITTNDGKIAEKARLLREHGGSNYSKYIGYNARMNTINAAFGRVQLQCLDQWIKRRHEISKLYKDKLADLMEIKLPIINDEHVYHLFVIQAEQRDELKEYLRKEKIFCGIHYPLPVTSLEPYKQYVDGSYPNAEYLATKALSIPMYPTLENKDIDFICQIIKEFYGEK